MIHFSTKRIPFLIIALFLQYCSFSQTVGSFSGKVIDAKTKLPLPSATIQIQTSTVSTITNNEASFRIITNNRDDTFKISSIGYQSVNISTQLFRNKNNIIELKPISANLGMVWRFR